MGIYKQLEECDPLVLNATEGCRCGCDDPDCDIINPQVSGCPNIDDRCFLKRCVPIKWICNDRDFGNGGACNCDCGALDPDCENSVFKDSLFCENFDCTIEKCSCSLEGVCSIEEEAFKLNIFSYFFIILMIIVILICSFSILKLQNKQKKLKQELKNENILFTDIGDMKNSEFSSSKGTNSVKNINPSVIEY